MPRAIDALPAAFDALPNATEDSPADADPAPSLIEYAPSPGAACAFTAKTIEPTNTPALSKFFDDFFLPFASSDTATQAFNVEFQTNLYTLFMFFSCCSMFFNIISKKNKINI